MNLLELMSRSIFLWPVAACGVIAGCIAAERLYYVTIRAALAPAPFFATIQKHVLSGQLDKAIAFCASAPSAPLANVVKAVLQNADGTREDLQLAVDQATADQMPLLQARIGYLATIANIVTLFGLLGTIYGLITSFDAVSQADPEQKQTLLAHGIALAMYTTAGGISVAIPTLAVYSIVVHRVNAIVDDLDRYGLRTVMLLLARQKGETPQQAAGA